MRQAAHEGVIDESVAIVGSLNWTSAGVKKNDENVLVIRGDQNVGSRMVEDFRKKFDGLPKYTAFSYPAAEGLTSIGTLVDGKDNSHSGYADPIVTRETYFRAFGEVAGAAHRVKLVEGVQAGLDAFREGMMVIAGEVKRVRANYEQRSMRPFFMRELELIANDIEVQLAMAEHISNRDQAVSKMKGATPEEINKLWDEQTAAQKQIDSISADWWLRLRR